MNNVFDNVYRTFRDRFDKEPVLIQSPGRVNLIGGHTDYNDGYVLPAAIDRSIIMAMALNNCGSDHFYSLNFDESFKRKIGPGHSSTRWANFLLGSIDQLKQNGYDLPGIDCVFGGDLPIGAGMSSSASLVGGAIFGLSQLLDGSLSKGEMARLGQKVENGFIGVQCGIMDYFANMYGEKNAVLKLDCRNLEYELYPFDVNSDFGIVLCDTGIRRELAGSEYNLRREQCETGVKVIQRDYPEIINLRDVNPVLLEEYSRVLDPVIYKRCRYIMQENSRVLEACNYLENNDLSSFGSCMFKSHEGLREQYEVSCPELDVLVDAAINTEGVAGARMMGGGFGGCTINLVEINYISGFMQNMKKVYKEILGKDLVAYDVRIGEGTRRVTKKGELQKA